MAFRVTNLSLVMILLNGFYISWHKYGAPGPEILVVFHAFLQWLIWRLAKNGKLNAAFGIPLIWGLVELGSNTILVLASDKLTDAEIPEHLRNDFPYASVAQSLGLFSAIMMVIGHLWMAGAMWKFMNARAVEK